MLVRSCTPARFVFSKINCTCATSSRSSSSTMNNHVMKGIAVSATNVVMPGALIKNSVKYCPITSSLTVKGKEFILNKNVILIGFGKAVLGMAEELHKLISSHIIKGILSVPVGATLQMSKDASLLNDNRIRISEGALNNLPDETAMHAAQEIFDTCCQADANKLIIALVSGGGSALLCLPIDGITIQEKRQSIDRLSKAGADIKELNTIRQAISKVKGGGLTRHSFPAKMLSLIISDIIGDPVDLIASGPTVIPAHHDCLNTVVSKHKDIIESDTFPESVKLQLSRRQYSHSTLEDQSMSRDDRISHFIIGNNMNSLEAAAQTVQQYGYKPVIISCTIEGDVPTVGQGFTNLAKGTLEILKHGKLMTTDLVSTIPFILPQQFQTQLTEIISQSNGRVCLLSGGEPTVSVKGNGIGGRNQELCLHFAKYCSKLLNVSKGQVTFMAFGTDGQDGPTDAAGGIVDAVTWQDMIDCGLNPDDALDRNDSNTLLKQFNEGRNLIETGLTGTNVMDIQVLLFDLKLL